LVPRLFISTHIVTSTRNRSPRVQFNNNECRYFPRLPSLPKTFSLAIPSQSVTPNVFIKSTVYICGPSCACCYFALSFVSAMCRVFQAPQQLFFFSSPLSDFPPLGGKWTIDTLLYDICFSALCRERDSCGFCTTSAFPLCVVREIRAASVRHLLFFFHARVH
jgi:hypothetical protein